MSRDHDSAFWNSKFCQNRTDRGELQRQHSVNSKRPAGRHHEC